MGGKAVRSASEVAIIAAARQCADDGMIFYRSPNDVVLDGGVNGVVGPHYFRFMLRVRRDPALNRRILCERNRPVRAGDSRPAPVSWKGRPMPSSDANHSPSAITHANMDESLDAVEKTMGENASLRDLEGLGPFPDIPAG